MEASSLKTVAELIHLAVAPIFLLSAVATTLTVFLGRLSRIVDRGRAIERQAKPEDSAAHEELLLLERRAHLIYRALTLGVSAAILVCLLMTLAFAGELLRFEAAGLVAALFMFALFCFTGALLLLLREVFLAVGSFQFRIHHPPA